MELIESIRRLVIEGQYEITVHARERMAERGVSTEDLISLIINGEIADEEIWHNHRMRKNQRKS